MEIKPSHKGLMHKDLGKAKNAPITLKDIGKELSSKDPAKRARGNFARMAKRHFKPLPKSQKKSA